MNAENTMKTGGWIVTAGDPGIEKHPEAKAAFEKAAGGLLGAKYEAFAVIATQVVAGINYCILCRITPVVPEPKQSIQLVYIYEDLNKNAKITDRRVLIGESALGGFEANAGDLSLDQNPKVKEAYEKALTGRLGVDHEAIAYLGSQIVSGTNYLILSKDTVVAPGAEAAVALLTVYEDLKGTAELIKTEKIVLGVTD